MGGFDDETTLEAVGAAKIVEAENNIIRISDNINISLRQLGIDITGCDEPMRVFDFPTLSGRNSYGTATNFRVRHIVVKSNRLDTEEEVRFVLSNVSPFVQDFRDNVLLPLLDILNFGQLEDSELTIGISRESIAASNTLPELWREYLDKVHNLKQALKKLKENITVEYFTEQLGLRLVQLESNNLLIGRIECEHGDVQIPRSGDRDVGLFYSVQYLLSVKPIPGEERISRIFRIVNNTIKLEYEPSDKILYYHYYDAPDNFSHYLEKISKKFNIELQKESLENDIFLGERIRSLGKT